MKDPAARISPVSSGLERALQRALGAERVFADAASRRAHSGDKWFASHLPEVVVRPRSAEEVAAIVRIAAKHRVPVTARGAGVGYVGGCVPSRGGIALSMMEMARILEISTADGVAVVEPGVITGHLQAAAKQQGLFYPPDPASLNESSIGGNLATNAGGPRCLKYGVTKNYVLGLQVVLADGDIVELGGRVHKNKTGFDLCGMFVGSEGMLGVITRATVKLLPHPPSRAALSCGFPSIESAAAAVQAVLGHGFIPSALEIADAFTLRAARKHLGADMVPDGGAHLLIELDGQTASVSGEILQIEALLRGLGATRAQLARGEEQCEDLWRLRRGFSESLKATGMKKLNEDVVVPRGRLVDLVQFAAVLEKKFGFPIACFGHAGDGNIHVNVMVADPENRAESKRASQVLDALFRQVLKWGGAITGEHGIGLAKKPWWNSATTPALRRFHRTIKAALDPDSLLNPGKFL